MQPWHEHPKSDHILKGADALIFIFSQQNDFFIFFCFACQLSDAVIRLTSKQVTPQCLKYSRLSADCGTPKMIREHLSAVRGRDVDSWLPVQSASTSCKRQFSTHLISSINITDWMKVIPNNTMRKLCHSLLAVTECERLCLPFCSETQLWHHLQCVLLHIRTGGWERRALTTARTYFTTFKMHLQLWEYLFVHVYEGIYLLF